MDRRERVARALHRASVLLGEELPSWGSLTDAQLERAMVGGDAVIELWDALTGPEPA